MPALLLAAFSCVWTCVAIFSARPSGPFTALSGPATGSSEFAAGITPCADMSTGAQGLLDVGSTYYVSDACSGTAYKFTAVSAGAPAKLIAQAPDGLTDGLALDHGVYYGIAGPNQVDELAGIYTFNPLTLGIARRVMDLPCTDTRGLAVDPVGTDLYATGNCGLVRISDPGSPDPRISKLATGDLGGIAVSADGRELWVVIANRDGVEEISSTGHELGYLTLPQQGVGVALIQPGAAAPPGRASLAGDLLVTDTQGDVELVDTRAPKMVTVIAAGGNGVGYPLIGSDGFLYVAKADQVDQLQPAVFGPVTQQALPPTSPTQSPSSAQNPGSNSGHARSHGGSLLVLLLITCSAPVVLIVLAGLLRSLFRWWSARRDRQGDARSGSGLEVTLYGEPSADPAAASMAEALPTGLPVPPDRGPLRRFLARLSALSGRSTRSPISEFGVPVFEDGYTVAAKPGPEQIARNRIRKAVADPDVLPSATTLRFAVLVLAALASTVSIYAHLSVLANPRNEAAATHCVHSLNSQATNVPATGNADLDCLSASIPTLARWSLVGLALLLLGALLVYLSAPWFIRHLARSVHGFDPDNEADEKLARELDRLKDRMGVRARPIWLHAPHAATRDARAFGRPSRPYVLINGSLSAMFEQSPVDVPGFTAIVTHEFAHLRNRDLRPTYATLAVWRAFLAVVLVPYLVSLLAPGIFSEPLHPSAYGLLGTTPDARITVTSLLLIALVTLSVRAVMRVREAHADATAAVYLEDDTALRAMIRARRYQYPSPSSGRSDPLSGLLRIHPRPTEREADLDGPSRLAAPGTAVLFAIGIAVSLVMINLMFATELAAPGWLAVESILSDNGNGNGNVPIIGHMLALLGPAAIFMAVALTAFGCVIVWRARLVEQAAREAGREAADDVAEPSDLLGRWERLLDRVRRGGPLLWSLAFALGVLVGVPLSAIDADAGLWGVFDISIPWEIADAAAAAAALTIIAVLIFAWARETAIAWLPRRTDRGRPRRSRRAPLTAAVALGALGAFPAVLTWLLCQSSSEITSFAYSAYSAALDGLFGARWFLADYYPLRFLWLLPGVGLLLTLPSICLALSMAARRRRAARAAGRAQSSPPATADSAPSLRKILSTALATAVLCELGGLLVAYVARTLVGGQRLNDVLFLGANSPYLIIEWMVWLTVTICTVAALVTTRSVRDHRLTAVLLTTWAATTSAAFLLILPTFTAFCGMNAYACAVELPHDLFAAYGFLAAQAPVYAAIASVLCLAVVRRRPRTASPETIPPPRADDAQVRGWRRRTVGLVETLVLLAFVANAACGVYIFYNQLLAY